MPPLLLAIVILLLAGAPAASARMVAWARANGRKIHGHNLSWCADQYTPAWVAQGSWTRATCWR